jgi:predicted RND superfamily exporter protein
LNPNCIFLTNKYQQEYVAHGNKARALQRVITKVGTATLMTNLTTAAGFATFITNSELLKEFGIISSLSIVALFFLCLIIIPFITVINLSTRKAPETFESQLH